MILHCVEACPQTAVADLGLRVELQQCVGEVSHAALSHSVQHFGRAAVLWRLQCEDEE